MKFNFKLPKRCPHCAHKLRADGTCQNKECLWYVPDESESSKSEKTEKESDTPKASDTSGAGSK